MQAALRNLAGMIEALPGVQQCIGKAGVQKAGFAGYIGELREEFLKAREILLTQATAGVSGEAALLQGNRHGIGGAAFDQPAAEDDDPHLEVGCLLDEDMLLCGEEPEQVAASYLVLSVAEQISSSAACDEIQLQLSVVMPPVGAGRVGVAPRHTVEICGKFEPLQHDDKK